jgi:predicted RNA-binding protein YlqC (UPF0109 family)
MEGLVSYMARAVVKHADDVQVSRVDGSSSVLFELRVHEEDVARVRGEDGAIFRAMQQILSSAGGDVKPVLDLVNEDRANDDNAADEE